MNFLFFYFSSNSGCISKFCQGADCSDPNKPYDCELLKIKKYESKINDLIPEDIENEFIFYMENDNKFRVQSLEKDEKTSNQTLKSNPELSAYESYIYKMAI